LQFSLAALVAVPKLPAETLAWLAAADSATSATAGAIPGLDSSFNAIPFLSVFIDTALGVAAVSIAHEGAHRLTAALRGVKLGPSLLVPNSSLGTFGAVTPTETPFKDRTTLWDVAAAGPIAGVLVAGSLFVYGLQVRILRRCLDVLALL
jgi:hypothetical protein